MAYEQSVHAKAIDLVRLAIDMTTAAGSGHPTSAASLAHLVTVLMYDHMRFDPAAPDDPGADRLVLSEGHACPIVYAAAADLGIAIGRDGGPRRPMTRDDAMTLREMDSPIDGHPNPAEGFPFFPAATGSLGQGLSIAAGLALAARLDGRRRRVFCLIGDGESREGQIAEALDFILDYDLRAVCPIFNGNTYGQSDHVSAQQTPERIAEKLAAAGFAPRMIDGHDPAAIRRALEEHAESADGKTPDTGPVAIVAQTVKAWGFEAVLGGEAHGKPVPDGDKDAAFAELEKRGAELGAHWTEGDLARPAPVRAAAPPQPADGEPPTFREALKQFQQENVLEKGKLAPRKAYGFALRALGHHDRRVVALDGDVRNSTFSEAFYKDPELRQRFFECKIAEQNMVSCAAGLAADGKIPFVSTFGKFLVRAYDQLEMAMIGRHPLKFVGSHVGVSIAADGPSQMALTDVAFFRALSRVALRDGEPLLYLLNPADAYAGYALTVAAAAHPGPCYLRMMRPDVPFLYDDATEFHFGGHHVLAEGGDLLIAASGYMVHEALTARAMLHERGVEATLVDLYSIPFDAESIVTLARQCNHRVLTLEDNYGAGFGSEVADVLASTGEPFRVEQMFVRRIPKSGRSPDDLLRYLGLSADDIVRTGTRLIESAPARAGT